LSSTPPPPQAAGDVHDPQLQMPPQPSATVPQLLPAHAVPCGVFVHVGVAQTLGFPWPPQTVVPVQFDVPQLTMPPQPSGIVPHWFGPHVVAGAHGPPSGPRSVPPPHTLGVPPPPHFWGKVHEPQLAAVPASSTVTPPHPSGSGPHWLVMV
jgi:hypothetical protein